MLAEHSKRASHTSKRGRISRRTPRETLNMIGHLSTKNMSRICKGKKKRAQNEPTHAHLDVSQPIARKTRVPCAHKKNETRQYHALGIHGYLKCGPSATCPNFQMILYPPCPHLEGTCTGRALVHYTMAYQEKLLSSERPKETDS